MGGLGLAAQDAYIKEIKAHQDKLTKEYQNPKTSPFKKKTKKFKGHAFYAIDSTYRVEAKLTRTTEAEPFDMPTSSGISRKYIKYASVSFELHGQPRTLSVYRSLRLAALPMYKDYFLIPFTDKTSGTETYGGGRYMDVRLSDDQETLILDFNRAYNPYCAYVDGYSCPIPPKENFLDVAVKAGIQAYE